jgi:hypothetical protein
VANDSKKSDSYFAGLGDFKLDMDSSYWDEMQRQVAEKLRGMVDDEFFRYVRYHDSLARPRKPDPEEELDDEGANYVLRRLVDTFGEKVILERVLGILGDMMDLPSVVMVLRAEMPLPSDERSWMGRSADEHPGWSAREAEPDYFYNARHLDPKLRPDDFRQSALAPKTPRSPRGRRK